MKARFTIRDDSMRRAALCERLEARSTASFCIAAAVLAVLLAVFLWQVFVTPCIGGPSC